MDPGPGCPIQKESTRVLNAHSKKVDTTFRSKKKERADVLVAPPVSFLSILAKFGHDGLSSRAQQQTTLLIRSHWKY